MQQKIVYPMATIINPVNDIVIVQCVTDSPRRSHVEVIAKSADGTLTILMLSDNWFKPTVNYALKLSSRLAKEGFMQVVHDELGEDWREFVL